jgi:hypothetical protein
MGYSAATVFFAFIFFIAVCLGIFLIIRSIMLWYWKVDVIVKNQDLHTELLHRQIQLLEQQNKLLTIIEVQEVNNPIEPGG